VQASPPSWPTPTLRAVARRVRGATPLSSTISIAAATSAAARSPWWQSGRFRSCRRREVDSVKIASYRSRPSRGGTE
jgi:hypothetical protein